MALTHDTTMAADAQARILSQYRASPNFVALMGQLGGSSQPLEDALCDLSQQTDLSGVADIWLDYLGAIVGENRDGFADVQFLLNIRARILGNKSGGAINELLAICRQVLAVQGPDFVLTEKFPAALQIEVNTSVYEYADPVRIVFIRLIRLARAAGVNLQALTRSENAQPATGFFFAPSTALVGPASAIGYGDTAHPTYGGYFRDAALA